MLVYKTKKADLRSKYRIYMECSLIIVLVMLIAAFQFSPTKNVESVSKEFIEGPIEIFLVPPSQQNTLPTQISRPPIPVISETNDPVDIEFEETVPDLNENFGAPPVRNDKNKIVEEVEEIIFKVSEEMPEPIGGLAEIQKKVRYTDFAIRIGIEGSVVIQAVINKNGDVVNAVVQKSLLADLDQISLEAVKSTMFKPGKQRGKPVNVQISIPITFKLR